MRCFATLEKTRLPGGSAVLVPYKTGEERQALSNVLTDVYQKDGIDKTVVLWGGLEPVEQTPIANMKVVVSEAHAWKEEVTLQFERVLRRSAPRGLTLPRGGRKWVKEELARLSNAPYPMQADIERVQRIATSFKISHEVRAKIESSRTRFRRPLHWVGAGSTLALKRGSQGLTWGTELLLYFARDSWHEGIPKPTILRLTPHNAAMERGSVPLYSVPDFKGLDRDIVILLLRGRTLAQKAVVYVGISRAKAMLVVLADDLAMRDLPSSFQWDRGITVRG